MTDLPVLDDAVKSLLEQIDFVESEIDIEWMEIPTIAFLDGNPETLKKQLKSFIDGTNTDEPWMQERQVGFIAGYMATCVASVMTDFHKMMMGMYR